jgi:hypothetical protein
MAQLRTRPPQIRQSSVVAHHSRMPNFGAVGPGSKKAGELRTKLLTDYENMARKKMTPWTIATATSQTKTNSIL